MAEFLGKWIGPLTWAYLIGVGGGLILTPKGPIFPTITIGVVSIVLGALGFAFGWRARSR